MKSSEEIFEQKTDFKEILAKLFRHKHYFILAIIFALGLAFLINKYSTPVYFNKTTLLIKDDKSGSFLSSNDVMQGFGLFGGVTNVENELAQLKSFAIVNQAVEDLDLEITYVSEEDLFPGNFLPYKSYKELYKNSPIHVIMDQTQLQPVDVRFYVDILSDSTYRLTASGGEVKLYNYVNNQVELELDSLKIDGVFKFGQRVDSEYYNFSVHFEEMSNKEILKDRKLFFVFNNIYTLSNNYQARLGVATTTTTSSVVIVSLAGSNHKKITDFLNTLDRVYLENSLEKKNKIAFNTVKFIDSRISDISDALMFAENKLQNFRSTHQAMNLSFQGQKLYEKINALETEKAKIQIMQKYYYNIKDYLEKNDDVRDLIAPSALETQDPVLNELIGKMLELNNERMNYLQENNSKNLFLKDLEVQINNLKRTIIENISYNSNKTEISLRDIESRMNKLSQQISRMPKTERQLIGMERKFKLNDAIYTFLLQKRAEAQIAQASNTADYEIIDRSYPFKASLISPKSMLNYIIALFLGLFFPFVFIVIRDFMNNKISETKDVENISSLPIIGQVLRNRFKSNAIIQDYPKSPLADSFRAIRTNLRFFAKGKDKMVILITSSVSGEGKSFNSVNIASVYALLGKKTVLLGFDLRRPSLFKDFNLNNDKGISSFLIENVSVDEIIQKTEVNNLDLISAGPVPPNPVELIASEKTAELFKSLRERYDYIIIDSSPIGVVTDSFLLFTYADINIFTIRHNYTTRDAVKSNLKNIEMKGISNVSILINDVKLKKNGYGYAYQSNYYSNTKKKKWYRKSRKK